MKKLEPSVTVIIPAKIRNEQEAAWLKEAYSSVRIIYPVVLVDDHSPVPWKRVLEICDFHPSENNIWHLKDKTGLAAARNEAMRHVSTEYFFPLDADDYLAPGAIETALKKYQGKGFLYGSTVLFSDKQRTIYKARPYDICKLLQAVYWPNGCLQKTENFHAIGGWDESLILYEDWDYWLRSAEAGITGNAIEEVLYCYRQNPNGIIQTLKRNPDMANRAKSLIVTRHEKLFSGEHPMSGCCGKGKIKTKVDPNKIPEARAIVIPAPLANGMVLLVYQGKGLTRSFYGASGTQYRFSSTSRKYGYVAEEDVPGLLALKEGGEFLFTTEVKV